MKIFLCAGCMRELKEDQKICPFCGFDAEHYERLPHHLKPETILKGRYLLGKVLGEGGFGITYLGCDLNLKIKVAIKEYYPSGMVTRSDQHSSSVSLLAGQKSESYYSGLNKFVDEACRLGRFLGLPGIVSVKDFFRENNTAYIVMEYIEGQTLKAVLAHQPGRCLPVSQVFRIMEPVMDSLHMVHQEGLIHRDISPDNLMMDNTGRMKLIDFGAARSFLANGEKSLSVLLKPGYAPEEQYRRRGKQGPWTDVYGLCATIYRAVTGVIPQESLDRMEEDTLKKPSELGIRMDPVREAVLMKGLSVYQKDRWQDVGEMRAALKYAAPEPELPRSPEPQPLPIPGPESQQSSGPERFHPTEPELLRTSGPEQRIVTEDISGLLQEKRSLWPVLAAGVLFSAVFSGLIYTFINTFPPYPRSVLSFWETGGFSGAYYNYPVNYLDYIYLGILGAALFCLVYGKILQKKQGQIFAAKGQEKRRTDFILLAAFLLLEAAVFPVNWGFDLPALLYFNHLYLACIMSFVFVLIRMGLRGSGGNIYKKTGEYLCTGGLFFVFARRYIEENLSEYLSLLGYVHGRFGEGLLLLLLILGILWLLLIEVRRYRDVKAPLNRWILYAVLIFSFLIAAAEIPVAEYIFYGETYPPLSWMYYLFSDLMFWSVFTLDFLSELIKSRRQTEMPFKSNQSHGV